MSETKDSGSDREYDGKNYYGDGPGGLTGLLHRLIPGAPFEANSEGKSTVHPTTLIDPRENDDLRVERRLTCGHGGWHVVTASLSTVFCHECWDTVEAEFRTLDGRPLHTGSSHTDTEP